MRKPSGGGAGHAVPGFLPPFGCRHSLLGSSCARWGMHLPHGRPTGGRSAGPQRGCRVAHEQDPTGQGALLTPGTVVRSRPAIILRPAPAAFRGQSLRPRWNIPSAGVTFTRRHQGFTCVHPSPQDDRPPPRAGKRHRFPPVFSSPAAPGWNKSRFGFYPGFAPRGYPRRTPRRRQAIAHWPEYYTSGISRTSNGASHFTHAPSLRT